MAKSKNHLDILAMDLFEASLKQISTERTLWIKNQSNIPLDVKERAIELLSFDESHKRNLQTGHANIYSDIDIEAPDRIGAYKTSKLIGQGGMGSVYLASRDIGDFEHKVAIKLIKPTVLSDTLVERFSRERQIMAGFTHPNIARLYDGGTTTNGVPYFIMEYIDGMSILTWANHKSLDIKDRLRLFISACEAIRYAHQNLIVHRDITPNNVLVTRDGVVKLIDFGIAKPNTEEDLVEGSSHSLASLSFTPGFAAPERSKGGSANTLSDIFSLGKLLEALMEDQPISSDLNAIIEKAIQEKPENRYIAVNAIIDDINRYNSGHAIKAYPPNKFYMFRKFIGRQKLAVSLGALAFTGLFGGLITTSFLYNQAETARAHADARFNDVRSIAKFMLYDLYDDLKATPGNTESLEKIAKESRHYLSQLNNIRTGNFDLEMETIRGYHRLAEITGNPFDTNLGRASEAANIYDETQSRLESLLKQHPNNPTILDELTKVLYAKAVLAFTKDAETEKAIKHIDLGLLHLSHLDDIEKNKPYNKLQRLKLLRLKGSATLWIDKGEEAIELLKSLEPDVINLFDENPNDLKIAKEIAEYYHVYAYTLAWHVYNIDEDDSLALPLYAKAVNRYKNILKEKPNWVDAKVSLAQIYLRRSETYVELEDLKSALQDNIRAAELLRDARRLAPKDQFLRRRYIMNQSLVMELRALQGQKNDVMKISQEIIELRRLDVANNPQDIGFIRLLANTLQMSGNALIEVGEKDQGCELTFESLNHINSYTKKKDFTELDRKNIVIPVMKQVEKCREN